MYLVVSEIILKVQVNMLNDTIWAFC